MRLKVLEINSVIANKVNSFIRTVKNLYFYLFLKYTAIYTAKYNHFAF